MWSEARKLEINWHETRRTNMVQKVKGRAGGNMQQALKLRKMGEHSGGWFMAFMRIWK